MKRLPRAVYTQEFRDQAVRLVLSDGLTASDLTVTRFDEGDYQVRYEPPEELSPAQLKSLPIPGPVEQPRSFHRLGYVVALTNVAAQLL